VSSEQRSRVESHSLMLCIISTRSREKCQYNFFSPNPQADYKLKKKRRPVPSFYYRIPSIGALSVIGVTVDSSFF
jgi:hypothetical protein